MSGIGSYKSGADFANMQKLSQAASGSASLTLPSLAAEVTRLTRTVEQLSAQVAKLYEYIDVNKQGLTIDTGVSSIEVLESGEVVIEARQIRFIRPGQPDQVI
jgi:hypothetical protein